MTKKEKLSLENLSPGLPICTAQVVWAVREEMAQNLDDVLSRRTRCLLLNAQESKLIAQQVAQIMAKELNKSKKWLKNQVDRYLMLAEQYHC